MKIKKDYTYLNKGKTEEYYKKFFRDEEDLTDIETLIRDFGGKEVFDAMMDIFTKKDIKEIMSNTSGYDTFDDIMVDAACENIYDVYAGAVTLLCECLDEEQYVELFDRFGRQIEGI